MSNSRLTTLVLCAFVLLAAAGCSRERQHWKSAEAADTIEAYDAFIQRHPDSELVTQARARVAQLSEEQDWQRASSTDTAASYQAFLVAHPDGKWAQEARIRVENFSLGDQPPALDAVAESGAPNSAAPAPAPIAAPAQKTASSPPPVAAVHSAPKATPAPSRASASGFGIQLGAYTTEARAQEEWQTLSTRFGAQLRVLKPRYVASIGPSGKVFRLQAATQNETQARALCAQLKQKAQPCVVVLP